jgi:hypothetical protein
VRADERRSYLPKNTNTRIPSLPKGNPTNAPRLPRPVNQSVVRFPRIINHSRSSIFLRDYLESIRLTEAIEPVGTRELANFVARGPCAVQYSCRVSGDGASDWEGGGVMLFVKGLELSKLVER